MNLIIFSIYRRLSYIIFVTAIFGCARENNGTIQKGAFSVHDPAAAVRRKAVPPFSVLSLPTVKTVLFRTLLKSSCCVSSVHPLSHSQSH